MRIYSLFLALLIFTSCKHSFVYLLEDAKDVKRDTRSDNHKKKRANYFIQCKGNTYYLESPSIEFISEDSLELSGTLREQDIKFKEVRDTMLYLPKKRIRNKDYTQQYIFKLSESLSDEIVLNDMINTHHIDFPVKRYKYQVPLGAYVGGSILGGLGLFFIIATVGLLIYGPF